MFNLKNLRKGDEVAFRSQKGAAACKAVILEFITSTTVRLSVNYNYTIYIPDPENIPDEWETIEVPLVRVVNYWKEYEEQINEKKQQIRRRKDNVARVTAKADLVKQELDRRGIKYRYTLGEVSVSVDDMEQLLGMRCFPRLA